MFILTRCHGRAGKAPALSYSYKWNVKHNTKRYSYRTTSERRPAPPSYFTSLELLWSGLKTIQDQLHYEVFCFKYIKYYKLWLFPIICSYIVIFGEFLILLQCFTMSLNFPFHIRISVWCEVEQNYNIPDTATPRQCLQPHSLFTSNLNLMKMPKITDTLRPN